MFVTGILTFSMIVPLVAYVVSKCADRDPGKVAASVVPVGWGSMMVGMLLARI